MNAKRTTKWSLAVLSAAGISAGALLARAHEPCPGWAENLFGRPGPSGFVGALAVFDAGENPSLYAGGSFGAAGARVANRLARFDGREWLPVGEGLSRDPALPLSAFVKALLVHDDGNGPVLFVGGRFGRAGALPVANIARWDGSRFSALGAGTNGEVRALAVYDDGSGPALFAGGNFSRADGLRAFNVARWDGAAWSPLRAGVGWTVHALAAFDDGTGPALYVAGEFRDAGGVRADRIARFDGTEWSALPAGGFDGDVLSLAVLDDGSGPALFAGGRFSLAGGVAAQNVARLGPDGWAPLGSGANGEVSVLLPLRVGPRVLLAAGGRFASAGGAETGCVATWDGSAWSPLGIGLSNQDGDAVAALARFDDGRGPRVFAGGSFRVDLAGSPVAHCARLEDGGAWRPPAAGVEGPVTALEKWSGARGGDDVLVVGGEFSSLGAVPARHAAIYDGIEFSPMGEALDGAVLDFLEFDDGSGPALFACGHFRSPEARVARFDGAEWRPAGASFDGFPRTMAVFDDGTGPALYVGGLFTRPGRNLVKFDGSSWTQVASGIPDGVFTMHVHDDGRGPALWIGAWPVAAAEALYRYDGTAIVPAGAGSRAYPWTMATFDDGSGSALYVGGNFDRFAGLAAEKIVRWDGARWTPVASGLGIAATGIVTALGEYDDGTGLALYAGGTFVDGTGSGASHVARWTGSGWTEVDGGLDRDSLNRVNSFAVARGFSGPALYAGGQFDLAGGHPSTDLARYEDPCARCGSGNVNAGRGRVSDVLFVNDSSGGPGRRIEMAAHEPLSIFVGPPPAAAGLSPFVLYLWDRLPEPGTDREVPGLGFTCFPTPLSRHESPQPAFVWNNTGKLRAGVPDRVPPRAPTIVLRRAVASRRPVSFHLQGIIADPGSAGQKSASVTNAVSVVVR